MTALALSPMASFRRPTLPWSNAADDEKRFQRIARIVLLVVLALGIVMPFVPLPQRARIAGGVCAAYGLLLCGVAFTY